MKVVEVAMTNDEAGKNAGAGVALRPCVEDDRPADRQMTMSMLLSTIPKTIDLDGRERC